MNYREGYNAQNSPIGKTVVLNKRATKGAITYQKGTLFTIQKVGFGNPDYFYMVEVPGIYFTNSQVDFAPLTVELYEDRIKDYKKEIKSLEESIKNDKTRIKFMKDNDLDEFEEEAFKAYAVLEIIEQSTTKVEKARAIASILK